MKSDGIGRNHLYVQAGGSALPMTEELLKQGKQYVFQDGKTVFKYAVSGMADVAADIMKQNHLTKEEVQWLVPHQANKRIIDATGHRMGLSEDKVMINIQKYGNTTSATIPLALVDYEKQLKKGDNIILAAFGGGFTWGAIYLKWAY
ncbi:3-oxoacyl-(acyl-carrier-protein) synthase 3 (fragment) [Capnocytophaga canimorsus]|uniref:3-oxoacyl-(Acyl-carrier-protein) synthase 3 n=1 Tax=Capnocytophaga canimorsus TaxID=28188 RepID=A0A0B7I6J5_9FLAO